MVTRIMLCVVLCFCLCFPTLTSAENAQLVGPRKPLSKNELKEEVARLETEIARLNERCESEQDILPYYQQLSAIGDQLNERSREPVDPLDQGGDFCSNATIIQQIPFCDIGTTSGYQDNFTPPCGFGAGSPDVVYRFTPTALMPLDVTLCGSAYNTVLHIWRGCPDGVSEPILLCCNDDSPTCAPQSCCAGVVVQPGFTYYIIVDGQNGAAGTYSIFIDLAVEPSCLGQAPCAGCVICPFGALQEGEACPASYPGINAGPTAWPIQFTNISCGDVYCGKSSNVSYLDHDAYLVTLTQRDSLRWCVFSEFSFNVQVSQLFGESCNVPFYYNDGQPCDTMCFGFCLDPGQYYVTITPNGPPGSVNCVNGDYTISLDCIPCHPCVECPLGFAQEGEPCPNYPDNFNGGCVLGAAPRVSFINCNSDICGTLWTDGAQPPHYDRDVYQITLTQPDSVIWTVFSNVISNMQIVKPLPGCTGTILLAQSYVPRCDSTRIGICLAAGTYWLVIESTSIVVPCEPYTSSVRCLPCSPCIDCPQHSIAENEPCPNFNDTYNAGCHSSPPSVVRVQCGDTICGTSAYYDFPDHDFYEVTLTARDTLTWCVEAQFAVHAAIFTPNVNCTSLITHAQGNAPACTPLCLSICLPPGTYWLYVAPVGSTGQTCKPYVTSVNCAPCPTGQTCTYADLDFDPFNDACGFNNVQLTCNDTICGEIILGPAVDRDWYTFVVPWGSPCVSVTANVFGDDTPGWYPFGQGLDPAIALYQADCTTQIALDNNSGVGNDALLTSPCLTPGIYHIQVGGAQNSTGPYILTLNCTPCPCPPPCPYQDRDFEPANNACQTVNVEFTCTDTLCGNIPLGPSQDEDWYLFFVFGPGCQRLTLDIFANSTPGYFGYLAGLDPIVELWDPSCATILASDDNSGVGNDAQLVSPCLPPGVYRVRVRGVGGSTGPYVMASSCVNCPCPNNPCPFPNVDFDPANDICSQASVSLTCADSICGEILPTPPAPSQPDVDWYLLTIPGPGCKSVEINAFANDDPSYSPFGGGLDPNLWLYKTDCTTLLEYDYDSGVGRDSKLISGCLEPGQYSLMVNSVTGSAGPYVLTVRCSNCACPCSLSCSPNLPMEGELCPNLGGDFFNGGCLTNPPSFQHIACGSRFCGSSFAMGGLRDTDWFQLSLTTFRRINWKVSAEFPFEMGIYKPNPNCSNLQTIRYTTGQPCETKQHIVKCLAPGTYYFYVAPTVYNGVPCSEYQSHLACGKCFLDHLVIHVVATGIQLNWDPDDSEPVYAVHRSTTLNFEPTEETVIARTTVPFIVDNNPPDPGVAVYYVVTMDSPGDVEP